MKGSGDFIFKRFAVSQSRSAMKVGTDGVLLGAWVDINGARSAIDIGAGTGLISLMLAQRGVECVTAIEIDPDAAAECAANVSRSPWPDAISTIATDIFDYSGDTVDLIVSNPPFFTEALHSPDRSRATARHADSMPLKRLLSHCRDLLNPAGRVALILPAARERELSYEATLAKLYPWRMALVNDYPGRPYKRMLVELSAAQGAVTRENFTLRQSAGGPYSATFAKLTDPFYLDQSSGSAISRLNNIKK